MHKGSVLFSGQCYYHAWYLSRELRKLGWRADVLNWDSHQSAQQFYHGEDIKFTWDSPTKDIIRQFMYYISTLFHYDIYHFSGAHNMSFGDNISNVLKLCKFAPYSEVGLLKILGKKIVYTNNGCLDGVSQSSFRSWSGLEQVCDICVWHDKPNVCCDKRNLDWGAIRNKLADYQCTVGGNRKDYNDDPRVHEVPEVYCLDPNFWRPDLTIPPKYRLSYSPDTVKLYHAMANFDLRTDPSTQRNIKSTHIYLPLIERLKAEGYPVELIFATNIPNKEVRFYQAQADIVVDMLSVGFFGANVREALMLGKPAICYLRPEWLESMRRGIPDYVDELPVISATPETIHDVLVDLIRNPKKRAEIGRRSREFSVKWHSAEAGAKRMDRIYSDLLYDKKGKKL